jgi:predicted GNAT family N-acyltransferase
MTIEIRITRTDDGIAEAQTIRNQVFVEEQKISLALDLDGHDDSAYHALAYDNGKPVGTARLVPDGNRGATMARIAVLPEYRSNGIAGRLIKAVEAKGRELNLATIAIHPHEHLRDYYGSKGYDFVKTGEVVGEHQLLLMAKTLTDLA